MSQESSRIHIRVSSTAVWGKFAEQDDAGYDLAQLADADKRSSAFIDAGTGALVFDDAPDKESFVYHGADNYSELVSNVTALSKTLGKEGIIIADMTDSNVDPFTVCVYYLGDLVRTASFGEGYRSKREMFEDTSIEDIPGWLNYGGFSVSKEEKNVLFRCGIWRNDKQFEYFSKDFQIPEKVFLRETSFKKRPETIEKTFIGEEVYLVHAKDAYDSRRLEVMSELGSLGYLPSDVSDKLTPVLEANRLQYSAEVVEIVPASQRNKHAKSSIVAISIKAEFSETDVVKKKSVPHVADREQRIALDKNRIKEAGQASEKHKQEEEARKAEEERRRKEEEARKAEEERRQKEEEAHKAEEERKRKEEEARKAEEERKRKEEEARKAEEQRRYSEAYRNWENECAEVLLKRSEYVKTGIDEERASMAEAAAKKYEDLIEEINKVRKEQEERKAAAEMKLASLGVFKFAEKKAQKAIIEEADKILSDVQKTISVAEATYKADIEEVEKLIEKKIPEVQKIAEEKYPLPEEPRKPEIKSTGA